MGNKGSMNNEEGKMGKKVGVLNRGGDEVRKVKARGVSREWKSVSREERRERVGMSEMGKEVVRLSKAERAFMSKKLGGGTVAECVKAAGWSGASEGNMSWGRWMNEKMERYEAVVMNKAAEADVMSAIERRAFLAAMVRDGGGAEEGKGLVVKTRWVEDGGREKVMMQAPGWKDKLRAVELDAKLSGDLKEEKGYEAINVTAILAGLGGTAGRLPMEMEGVEGGGDGMKALPEAGL